MQETIESVEAADTRVLNLSKLQGKGDFYHIRIGDYRIGVSLENDVVTFVRCLNRREIYKYFP